MRKDFWGKYWRILILDDYVHKGNSLRTTEKLINEKMGVSANNIYFGALNVGTITPQIGLLESPYWQKRLIFQKEIPEGRQSPKDINLVREAGNYITERNYGKGFKIATERRKDLSNDIKEYIHEVHPELEIQKRNKLEKRILTSIFSVFALTGLIFSTNSLTGNVIGITNFSSNFLWAGLFITGLAGLFLTKKHKK